MTTLNESNRIESTRPDPLNPTHAKIPLPAIQNLQEYELGGRPIFVREDREDKDLTEAGYGRDRDHGHGGGGGGGGRRANSEFADGGGRRERGGDGDGNSVFVGNLSWTTDEDSLAEYMGRVGTVASVKIHLRHDGKSKGRILVCACCVVFMTPDGF
jgi:RNA recognition motif-containing protein